MSGGGVQKRSPIVTKKVYARTLFVFAGASRVTTEALRHAFSKWGPVEDLSYDGPMRKYAWVRYQDEASCVSAVAEGRLFRVGDTEVCYQRDKRAGVTAGASAVSPITPPVASAASHSTDGSGRSGRPSPPAAPAPFSSAGQPLPPAPTTPRNRSRSPARRSRSPARRPRLPVRTARSPGRRFCSPPRAARSPARRLPSLARAARRSRSPVRAARRSPCPARRSPSPARRSPSPARRSRSPARRSPSPARRSRSPDRRSRSPAPARASSPARAPARSPSPARASSPARSPRRSASPLRRSISPARRLLPTDGKSSAVVHKELVDGSRSHSPAAAAHRPDMLSMLHEVNGVLVSIRALGALPAPRPSSELLSDATLADAMKWVAQVRAHMDVLDSALEKVVVKE